MAPRLRSLLAVPIAFAHRGARAHADENTLEAFRLAVRLGATGLESDVWLSADGEVILDHDGVIGPRWRRRRIGEIARRDLPGHLCTLAELYDLVGTDLPISIDVKDPAAFDAVVATARNAGGRAEEQLWLCHPVFEQLVAWRHQTSARLVDSTRLARISEGAERRAFRLRDQGIDAINLRQGDWSGGLVAMFHRFERYALGWDAQHARELSNLLRAGIDGVYSDHADRMVAAVTSYYPNDDDPITPEMDWP